MNYTTKQLADLTNSELIGDGSLQVTTISFDSRTIYSSADNAFIAINTKKNSGEKYIHAAIDKGIKIIISEHKSTDVEHITWIIVENSLRFIQRLAKHHLSLFNLKTVGITGSNGKTIVKEWLYQSLSTDFNTVKSPKSFNSQLGLPLSLLKIEKNHEVGIFEVGISRPAEMEILENIFSPKIGVLTHIGSAHSSNFVDEEELINEKVQLFKHSETIIFNGDNDLVYSKINDIYSSKKLISYGLEQHNDITITNDPNEKPNPLQIRYFNDEFQLSAQQRDEATLRNALCVVAVLKEFGFDFKQIVDKINALKSVEMRLESVNGLRNNLIINDSFNLDLDSLKIAYQFIKEYNKPRNTLILTDFVEGNNSEQLYR